MLCDKRQKKIKDMEKFPLPTKQKSHVSLKRGAYDKETVYAILDESLFCTLAFSRMISHFKFQQASRVGDKIYIHGSVGSSYMRELAERKCRYASVRCFWMA